MGRALVRDPPLHGNEFVNRPIGHPPAGSGLVIMGCAAGPGCPVRPGGKRGRCRWVLGDHGACAQGRMPVTWQWILQSTDQARASGELRGVHDGARSAGSPRCAAASGLRPKGACWWRSGQVIMGRALVRDPPLHGNEFVNRPIGHPPAGSGQVIMGRAAGPGCPVRPGANEDVAGGCWVIMGRALKAGCPLRGNGFSNRPIRHAPAGSCGVCTAGARSAGSPRCAAASGLRPIGACWWRSGQVIMGRALKCRDPPLHGNEFVNRPIGHPPAGSGQVIMGRAAGPGCPVRPGGKRGALPVGAG